MLALSVADVRDYVIIIFAIAGALAFLLIILISFLAFRRVGSILDVVRGNLESTRTTLGNAAATSSLLSDAVIKPVIKTSSFLFGVRQGVVFALKLARRVGGS
ncbi:MAG: hypothetical protein V3U26_04885 [Dehalococcoidia bacterium]